ncbi:MAG: hypothetical protein FWD53_00855 [Phycisphaerales bacterium]|nr:hypothetical protein [Phycisphaerales bacterium]
MRELIGKYGYYIVGIVFVLAVILAVIQSRNKELPKTAQTVKVFYVDEETGEEDAFPLSELPPLAGKSGNLTMVRAYKFSTDGGASSFIVYLEKYSDVALEELKTTDDELRKSELLSNGLMIRLPGEGKKWIRKNSPEADRTLMAAFAALSRDGSQPTPVQPKE